MLGAIPTAPIRGRASDRVLLALARPLDDRVHLPQLLSRGATDLLAGLLLRVLLKLRVSHRGKPVRASGPRLRRRCLVDDLDASRLRLLAVGGQLLAARRIGALEHADGQSLVVTHLIFLFSRVVARPRWAAPLVVR